MSYVEAHKKQIFCGSPTLDDNGNPEMMLIILDVPDLASAEAFIQAEPYIALVYLNESPFDMATSVTRISTWRIVTANPTNLGLTH